MLNRAQLIGHAGKAPEIRTTKSGAKCANFSLATSERWKDRETGEQKEKTEWHRIIVWGDELVTKVIEPYVMKGSKLYIEGKITTREWTDDKEIKRYATEIVVQGLDGRIQLLDRKENGRVDPPPQDEEPDGRFSSSDAAKRNYGAPLDTPPASKPNGNFEKQLDDEIPF